MAIIEIRSVHEAILVELLIKGLALEKGSIDVDSGEKTKGAFGVKGALGEDGCKLMFVNQLR